MSNLQTQLAKVAMARLGISCQNNAGPWKTSLQTVVAKRSKDCQQVGQIDFSMFFGMLSEEDIPKYLETMEEVVRETKEEHARLTGIPVA